MIYALFKESYQPNSLPIGKLYVFSALEKTQPTSDLNKGWLGFVFNVLGFRLFFGAYINCPEQNFSDLNNLRPSTLKTNPGQPLLRSDGRCVFSNAQRTKFHFINLMRRAIFVFRYKVRFFPGVSPPKYARVDLAPNCLPQHPSGEDVPKKWRIYWKRKLLVSSSLYI